VQCRSGEEEGTLTGHRVCLCVQAFKVIDTNSDGFITREDLQEIMTSLCTLARMRGLPPSHTGMHTCVHCVVSSNFAAPKEPTEAEISEMMDAAPDGIEKINWIMFLTMFAEKMEGRHTAALHRPPSWFATVLSPRV
jgi:hypothetical protein